VNRPIVIAGGGTGGHVFVAQAIADALGEFGVSPDEMAFVGSSRGQERTLLADSPTPLHLLPGRGIRRSLAPRAVVSNIAALWGILRAAVRAIVLVGRWRPRAVVSVGGYAAAPVGLAAAIWRRPLVLVNIDAVPGLTHRLLSRFATASCVSVEGTSLRNPVVTGTPVRAEFARVDRSDSGRRRARQALGCDPEIPLVAVVTGSLGARSVNRATVGLAQSWGARSATIYHVTGQRDIDEVEANRPRDPPGDLTYRVVPFEPRMDLLYAAADVAITRSGALTVGELAVCGVAGVLVPLPDAPGDHQTKNAQALVTRGAAVLVPDAEVSAERLASEVGAILDDPSSRRSMEDAARRVGHPQASREVAEVVLRHVR